MKKIRLFLLTLAVISFTAFYSCKQAPKEDEEQTQEEEVEEIKKDTMGKTEKMIEEAEQMEENSATKEDEME